MKVFESLNCSLCKEPFARVANQPRSPRLLFCENVICHECFEIEELLEEDKREHQCDDGDCFQDKRFAYFLIELLSQQDTLTIAPMEGGYILSKPFKIPECPICHDEYSISVENKKSFGLFCGHIICTECYRKSREPTANNLSQYGIICPKCDEKNSYDGDEAEDQFHDFLRELPEMIHQLESMLKAPACAECNNKKIIDDMFLCGKCSLEICGTCAYQNHQGHGAILLLDEKAKETFEELRGETTRIIKTYKYTMPKLYKNILNEMNSFEKKLLSKEETLINASTFVELKIKNETLEKRQNDFEKIVEEYMPHLFEFGIKIKRSIESLDAEIAFGKKQKN